MSVEEHTSILESMRNPPTRLHPQLLDLANKHRRGLAGIRGRLLSDAQGKSVRSIMVTSGLKGEGKTTVAITLAVSLAASSNGVVLLIDCNLDAPILHSLFEIPSGPGLADVVLRNRPLEDCVWPTDIPNLYILPWGDERTLAANVIGGEPFRKLIRAFRDSMKFVIADSAPLLSIADMLLALPAFDGVLEVVRCEQTQRDVPRDVKDRIEGVGGTFAGAVLNRRRYYLPRFLYGSI